MVGKRNFTLLSHDLHTVQKYSFICWMHRSDRLLFAQSSRKARLIQETDFSTYAFMKCLALALLQLWLLVSVKFSDSQITTPIELVSRVLKVGSQPRNMTCAPKVTLWDIEKCNSCCHCTWEFCKNLDMFTVMSLSSGTK